MKLDNFEQQVFFTTVRISVSGEPDQGASIGTGFIFQAPVGDPENRVVVLLISNKHVFGDPTRQIALNFHKRSPDPAQPSLGEIVSVQSTDFSGIYVEHPTEEVDLACLNISPIADPKQEIFYKHLHPEILLQDEQLLLPGNDVWFVGYPENRFDTVNNLPILRRGHIASIPEIAFNGRDQFVIDAQVFPGSSGSPVFSVVNQTFKLVGVVTQTMIKHQELEAVPAGTQLGISLTLGLGIVLKAKLVGELIDIVLTRIREHLAGSQPEPTTPPKEQ